MNEGVPQIVLASASPRRRTLLQQIGLRFVVKPAAIDEQPMANEQPETFVCRLAAEKSALKQCGTLGQLPVLGADTIVVVDNCMLGKPTDRESARAMLKRLSGREHRVLSAVSLRGREHWHSLSETRVWFRELTNSEIDHYWETGEPRDKAGGYGIQGVGGLFVRRIEGSYSGVVGLPLYETADLLGRAGISLLA